VIVIASQTNSTTAETDLRLAEQAAKETCVMTTTTIMQEAFAAAPHSELEQSGARDAAAQRPAQYAAPNLIGTRNGWAMRAVYFVSDLAAFAASLALAKCLTSFVNGSAAWTHNVDELKLYTLWAIGLVAAAALQQTYAAFPPRPVRKFRGWVNSATAVCGAIVGAAWLLNIGNTAIYCTLIVATITAVLVASFCRAVCRIAVGRASWWGTRLIVVGGGNAVARAYADLVREPQWGLRPVGYVDDMAEANANTESCLGSLERLEDLAAALKLDRALLAVHSFDADELSEVLSRANGRIKHWIILPPLERFPSLWLEACEAARRPALAITNRLRSGWSLPLKRGLDLTVALTLGIAVLPLVGLIVALIRVSSPGPIFYGQERIGRLGRRFKAWKFRTMLPDADAVLVRYLDEHPELAAEWKANHKLRSDPRVTWIGRWLRSTSLDELPQVWNVIVGEMSLVGPRPIVAAEIDKYAENYEQYVQVLPGITGLWQVSGRNNTTYEERVALDVYYVQNWSLWLDIYILACTAKVVLLCEGAY
jgi:Undecaprenyl-phosphate galactose phosphotransferase WbaP